MTSDERERAWTRPILTIDDRVRPSPIHPLLASIPGALERMAPERTPALRELVDRLEIVVVDEDRCRAYCTMSPRRIVVTRGLFECVWCLAFACFAFKQATESKERGSANERVVHQDGESEEITAAFACLREVVGKAHPGRPIDWTGLPKPPGSPAPAGPASTLEEKVADVFLGAIAFIVHHELAHLALGHQAGAADDPQWTLAQEKEADSRAIEWALDAAPDSEGVRTMRGFAIVLGTMLPTVLRIESVRRGAAPVLPEADTHPAPYDRMDKALRHDRLQSSDLVRETVHSIAVVAVTPYVRLAELPLAEPFEDAEAALQGLFDAIAGASVG